MAKLVLPPLVRGMADGEVTWLHLKSVDYGILGYFLSCHLIIEHYIDEYLKIRYPSLDWDAARHTFGQKAALLTRFKVSDRFDCIPAIKHLNSIRNKLSHDIQFKIDGAALLPLRQYVEKAHEGRRTPVQPKRLLEEFTVTTCVLFAGYITAAAHQSKHSRK